MSYDHAMNIVAPATRFVDFYLGSKSVATLKDGTACVLKAIGPGEIVVTVSGREVAHAFCSKGILKSCFVEPTFKALGLEDLIARSCARSPQF